MGEIFLKMSQAELTPNMFYILYCMHAGIVPDKSVNSSLEITRLKANDWLSEDLDLTNKSIIFMVEIDGYFKKSKKLTSKELMGDNFMLNIQAYVNIFPNKKLSSGKYARVPAKSLENSFRWFFDTYNFDWQIIFSATQKYISEYESKDYEYMRNSQYFLRKQNIDKSWDSDLATYCEYLSNDPEEENENYCELIV